MPSERPAANSTLVAAPNAQSSSREARINMCDPWMVLGAVLVRCTPQPRDLAANGFFALPSVTQAKNVCHARA